MNKITRVPFVDLNRSINTLLQKRIEKRIKGVIEKNDFILGSCVSEFEKEYAKYLGVKYCIGVASGTDAIMLSLLALGISQNDEVIVPAMSFFATVSPLLYIKAKPVFVDIEKETPLIDPIQIEQAITKRTKAIIVVHLHGTPADMDRILSIGRKYKIPIIEDACQGHGAEIQITQLTNNPINQLSNKLPPKRNPRFCNSDKIGNRIGTITQWRKVGSIGDVGCFSFYPAKNLGAYGDGGAVLTDNEETAERIKMLRNYGQKEKYNHLILGYNSRLDTLQGAVLLEKLPYLDKWNESRRKSAEVYLKLLERQSLGIMKESKDKKGNYHIFGIRTNKRDKLKKFFDSSGIGCGIHYPSALHMLKALKFLGYNLGDFPNAEKFAQETLSLPMFPFLKEEEIEYTTDKIKKFLE
jgi:dTDP-4-amino-4,6-dideoxygalactose transaminase